MPKKKQHMKLGDIPKPISVDPFNPDDVPFRLPPSWRWVRLQDITSYIQRGKSPKYADGDGPLVISQKCIQWDGLHLEWAKSIESESLEKYQEYRFFQKDDLLWNSTGTGTIGRIIKIDDLGTGLVCDSHVTVVRCLLVDQDFVKQWLMSDYVYGTIEKRAAGSTNQVELTATMAHSQIIPLPPLAEQHRIVIKVDELLALCNKLGVAQEKREEQRDLMVSVSLDRINSSSGKNDSDYSLEETTKFYINHLPYLTTRPVHVEELRKTILNLAVRGKLVKQDKDNDTVQLLISNVQAKRESEGCAKESVEATLDFENTETKFSIPESWHWVRLGFITHIIMGQSPPGSSYNKHGEGIPLINGPVEFSDSPFGKTVVNQYTTMPKKLCKKGDFLICVRGSTTGRTNVAGNNACIGRGVAALQPLFDDMFVRLFIWSWRNQIIEMGRGAAFPSITKSQLFNLPTPLPPYEEQQRVVAKVHELMALCDGLETNLFTTRSAQHELLEAALNEARVSI